MVTDRSTLFSPRTLLLVWLISGLCWGFLQLAMVIMAGETFAIDSTIMYALRSGADLSDPVGPGWLEEIMRDATALGSNWLLIAITLVVAWYLVLIDRKRMAAFLILAIISGIAVSFALKLGFSRPRPDLVPHHTRIYTSSFPSGHAMMSAVTYLTLAGLLAQIQSRRVIKALVFFVAIFTMVLVGASRVYLGVHWPSDVVAGWCAGAFWAMMCFHVAKFFRLRRAD
ncbi:phosphatase PAP2 family protein [Alteromonas ponticola]|uniref:undecaprenyl-diphosphate phosphatase n=1 Tax=Alteromonas ponticola TaxID=2720613 RepID=A0ABX1R4G0_9ALTE|nr:phosphatase PAP2 family protein [Alteromonas ponticola]NMH60381.1 phosphatase PAP2 family protein [Alteromonas ponticola]